MLGGVHLNLFVHILAGVIFCLDVGLRGLSLVSVVMERAFCDVLVDVFFDFLFFSCDFLGVRGLLVQLAIHPSVWPAQ